MEHNEKMIKKIKKKLKNEESKNQISTLSKENKKINEKILENKIIHQEYKINKEKYLIYNKLKDKLENRKKNRKKKYKARKD